ncbi:MAG: 50S ribosomal protein L6 [Methanocellales archaeon]|nr:50S ribosomal protein L6 [Methanocellales archaeon]
MKETRVDIQIPEEINVIIEDYMVKISGPKGELQREFVYPGITITKTDSKVIVDTQLVGRSQIAMIGTFVSHIKNMIIGVTKGFEYKLKVVYAHFPIQVKVEGSTFSIGNFLGERKPRKAKILPNVDIQIVKDEIFVRGINKEYVAQTAANMEQATRIKRRDPRVFQDGVHVVGWSQWTK